MTLELVSEEVSSGDLSTLFPFNALRNHALLLVRTEVNSLCWNLLLRHLICCPFAKIVHACCNLAWAFLFGHTCLHAQLVDLELQHQRAIT